MNIAIKREQSGTCAGSAEREQFGTKFKKITTNFLRTAGLSLAAAVALCGMTACTNDDNIIADEPATEQPAAVTAYQVNIPATIGGDGTTRAVDYNSETGGLDATFTTADNIVVYLNKSAESCYSTESRGVYSKLHPDQAGKSANLTGTMKFVKNYSYGTSEPLAWATLEVDDQLTLYYNTANGVFDYSGQTGTLAGLSGYDFAEATVTVVSATGTSTDGYTATTTKAQFENAQSMFRLAFSGLPTGVGVKSVTVSSAGSKLHTGRLSSGDVTITLDDAARTANGEGVVYAALRFDALGSGETDDVTFDVTGTDDVLYTATKTSPSGGFANGKYYKSSIALAPVVTVLTGTVNLATITSDATIGNGATLTGTLSSNVKITIADDAAVTLDGVTINGENMNKYAWAGLTCEGDATITLIGTNTVRGFQSSYPGIQPGPAETTPTIQPGPARTTLTIQGSGSLAASSNGSAPGIGPDAGGTCGNIVIQGSATVTANGGTGAAGIGSAATVYSSGYSASVCGDITIGGSANVTATGGQQAAGIGTGKGDSSAMTQCGDIRIEGGTVTATGGLAAAAIGSSWYSQCGTITITDGITSVTATREGTYTTDFIGVGYSNSTCGTVSIADGLTDETDGNTRTITKQ